MPDDERAHLRDEVNRERFALRGDEQRMAAGEQALERELEAFDVRVEHAKAIVGSDLREGHWGREPERVPSWQARADRPERDEPPA
jgi:hypothetical protein